MTWARLCDTMHANQKAHEAGLEAMGLWAMCASWCGQQLSDGHIPEYIVRMYGGERWEELAKRLVEARAGHEHGLWVTVESGGWRFHDWAENGNPSRVDVLADRERWREKARRRRGNGPVSLGESLGVSPGDARGESLGVSWKGQDSSTRELVPSGTLGGTPPGTTHRQVTVGKRPKPPWCGQCDETTRQIEGVEGRIERCQACHPLVRR